MTQKTPLFQQHRDSGATMINFHGWELPLHYGSQINEHQQVRQAAGMFDVSHMLVIEVKGHDASAFLSRLLANDIHKIQVARALYSCMLNEQGGIIDDLIAYQIGQNDYRLIINASNRHSDMTWIKQQIQTDRVNITPRPDLAILAVQGPQALTKIQQALPQECSEAITQLKPFSLTVHGEQIVARTGYTGENGYEFILPADKIAALWQNLLAQGVSPCGLGARDTLRLEAGLSLYGSDMNRDTTPYEVGLAWTVSLSEDRDFMGKQALQQQQQQGIPRKRLGVILDGKGVLRPEQIVHTQDGQTGKISSGTFSPTLKQAIGFALVPSNAQSLTVTIRNKQFPLKIVDCPFIKKQKN